MTSDLGKHPETQTSLFVCQLGASLMLNGHLASREKMQDWIMGFN